MAKDKKKGYLTDGLGVKSSTRLMSMVCLWVGILIALIIVLAVVSNPELFDKTEYVFLGSLIALFLILAFMPKVLQKIIEKAIETTSLNDNVEIALKKHPDKS